MYQDSQPEAEAEAPPMVLPFPAPGPLVHQAYNDLDLAASLTPEQQQALGDTQQLPRPWDPASCTDPALRRELWDWLDDVVSWHNHEHVWDPSAAIPPCWPDHPHLVHEIAVLADQRRHAGCALTSELLDEWHRYSLPTFTDRLHAHVREHCTENHQAWPAQGRSSRYRGSGSTRRQRFDADSGPLPRR